MNLHSFSMWIQTGIMNAIVSILGGVHSAFIASSLQTINGSVTENTQQISLASKPYNKVEHVIFWQLRSMSNPNKKLNLFISACPFGWLVDRVFDLFEPFFFVFRFSSKFMVSNDSFECTQPSLSFTLSLTRIFKRHNKSASVSNG